MVKVTAPPLPVPVAPDPVPVAPAAVVVTEAEVVAAAAFWLLEAVVCVAAAEEEDEAEDGAEAWEAVLEGPLLLATEVVLELLPSVIWKGKLYWKMVVLESSWSLRPYTAYPSTSLVGVQSYEPRALSMCAILGCQHLVQSSCVFCFFI